MSTNHEQQTELTNVDETKLAYPNRTKLTNNDSTKIDYTIRLILANPDDLEKENDRSDIQRFDIAEPLEHTAEEDTSIATDASIVQGHMHLRIIIYLLQFLLCLIQVLLLFNRIRKQR